MNDLRPGRRARALAGGLVLVPLLGASGCGMTARRANLEARPEQQRDIAVGSSQLRLRMRGLVDPMCGELERAADAIQNMAQEPAVRRAALDWKIEAVPALREALYQPDPLVALMDTWVLLFQMAEFFEQGKGTAMLGAGSAEAATACRQMEEELARVAASATHSADISGARARAREWAAAHPIRDRIAGRESVLSSVFARELSDTVRVGEAVVELTTTLDDLNRRVEVYSAQLPRQMRWEAERFQLALLATLPVDQAVPVVLRTARSAEQAASALERLAPALEAAGHMTEDLPQLIATERAASFAALHQELLQTIEFAHAERVAALEHITRERIATLRELQTIIAQERANLLRDLEPLPFRVVDHASGKLERLLVLALSGLGLLGLLGLLLVRWLLFRLPLELRRSA